MHMSLDNRHKLALPYWARPGIRTFAAPAGGGGGDDEDDEDDDGDDDTDDDEDDDDDELDEEEARAELKAVRKALKDANAQGAKRRTSVKTLKARLAKAERDLATAKSAPKPKGDDDKSTGNEVDVEAVKSTAKLEAEQAAEVKIKRAEVRGALRGAGVKADLIDKAARLIDLDDLDVNDDGSVDGIDEAIADARKTVPSLFGAKPATKRRSVAGPSDRDGERGPKPRKMTTTEIQAAQIQGKL